MDASLTPLAMILRFLSRITNSADRHEHRTIAVSAEHHSINCDPPMSQEKCTMFGNTSRSEVPAQHLPSPRVLRAGLGLAVVTSLFAFAIRLQAQQHTLPAINIRPVVGAIVGTGDQADALKSAVLVGGQASFAVHPNLSLVGSFAWSPSQDKLSPQRPDLDLYQYDLGIEARTNNLTENSAIVTRPYAVLGGGGRTYNLRNVDNAGAQTNPLGYGAVGLDLVQASGKIGLRFEARDNVTGFKGFRGELADRKARNDLQFSAGLTFGF
jgi:hypothetical protein